MDYVDQRAIICVAGGIVAGALVGAHLKGMGMSWCPALWGTSDDGKGAGSAGQSRSTWLHASLFPPSRAGTGGHLKSERRRVETDARAVVHA